MDLQNSLIPGVGRYESIMKMGVDIAFFSRRLWVLLSLCVVTPLGFLLWEYEGPGRRWFNYYASCMIYEIFWCLVVFLFRPRREKAAKIAAVVFLVTCFLEALQLWEPMFLEKVRATYLGMALIGTCFVWRQFPYYVVGSLIGWLWMRLISKRRCDRAGNGHES